MSERSDHFLSDNVCVVHADAVLDTAVGMGYVKQGKRLTYLRRLL